MLKTFSRFSATRSTTLFPPILACCFVLAFFNCSSVIVVSSCLVSIFASRKSLLSGNAFKASSITTLWISAFFLESASSFLSGDFNPNAVANDSNISKCLASTLSSAKAPSFVIISGYKT